MPPYHLRRPQDNPNDKAEAEKREQGVPANAENGPGDNDPNSDPMDAAFTTSAGGDGSANPGRPVHHGVMGGASQAEDAEIAAEQGKLGPSAGTVGLNKGPSDTRSADPHNPEGGNANGPALSGENPRDGGMGQSPAENAQPGTQPHTKENPSL